MPVLSSAVCSINEMLTEFAGCRVTSFRPEDGVMRLPGILCTLDIKAETHCSKLSPLFLCIFLAFSNDNFIHSTFFDTPKCYITFVVITAGTLTLIAYLPTIICALHLCSNPTTAKEEKAREENSLFEKKERQYCPGHLAHKSTKRFCLHY